MGSVPNVLRRIHEKQGVSSARPHSLHLMVGVTRSGYIPWPKGNWSESSSARVGAVDRCSADNNKSSPAPQHQEAETDGVDVACGSMSNRHELDLFRLCTVILKMFIVSVMLVTCVRITDLIAALHCAFKICSSSDILWDRKVTLNHAKARRVGKARVQTRRCRCRTLKSFRRHMGFARRQAFSQNGCFAVLLGC